MAKAIHRERVAPGIWRRTSADGKARYEITYRDSDGRQRRHVVEGKKKDAETALADVKSRMGRGQRVAPRPSLTFGEAAERFVASERVKLRPTTLAAYEYALNVHLLPAWRSVRLDRLDVDAVASLIERMQSAEYRREVELRTRGASKATVGYKTWTIRGALTPAGRVFDYASRRLGWAGTNPVRQLTQSERPRGEQRERRILARDELSKLVAAAESPYREIFATAGGLGTRLGETLGLTWADVDLDAGQVGLRYQLDRHGKRVPLKTKRSRRVIDAPAAVVSLLRAHKLRTPYSGRDDLVFASRSGGPLDHRNVAGRALERAVKRAGLNGERRAPTFHELRHAHASAFIAVGGDLVELSARLGHRDPSITASTYSHEFETARRSAERRALLDGMYDGLGEGAAAAAGDGGGEPSDRGKESAAAVVALRRPEPTA